MEIANRITRGTSEWSMRLPAVLGGPSTEEPMKELPGIRAGSSGIFDVGVIV